MAPIDRCHDELEPAAAQNVLHAQGDKGGVLAIVIKRVAAGDALDDEPGRFVKGAGNARFLVAENSPIGLGQIAAQSVRQKARRVQHDPSLTRPIEMVPA